MMLDPLSPMAQRQAAEMDAASRGRSPKSPYIAGAEREPIGRNLPAVESRPGTSGEEANDEQP